MGFLIVNLPTIAIAIGLVVIVSFIFSGRRG